MKNKELLETIVFKKFLDDKISYEKYMNIREFIYKELSAEKASEILKEQYLRKTVHSVVGVLKGGIIPWAIYRGIRAVFDKCSRSCGAISINTFKRQLCMSNCKMMAAKQELFELQKLYGQCNRYPDPAQCQKALMGKITTAKRKLQAAAMKVQKAKTYGIQKGKNIDV